MKIIPPVDTLPRDENIMPKNNITKPIIHRIIPNDISVDGLSFSIRFTLNKEKVKELLGLSLKPVL